MILEPLESRLAPASASFNLPATGFAGNGAGGMILNVPVKVSNLANGLGAANIAVSFPTGVFNFPLGGNGATADVALGAIPTGGAANWNLTANSTADGLLNITLSAKPGKSITTSIAANSLVLVNFPISPDFNPPASTSETITIGAHNGSFNTQIVGGGSTGAYALSPGPPYTGTVTVNPIVELPPTITTPQSYATEANTPINQAAPGLLLGAKDPQGQVIAVNTIDGAAYVPGAPLTLPSGAVLTVNGDGSFTYVPASNFVGADSFTFTVADTGSNVSKTGTVTLTMMPTLSLVPEGSATGVPGDIITEDVVLDDPNPPGGVGPLTGYDLALTYDASELSTASDGSQTAVGAALPGDWVFTANAQTPGVVGIGAFGSGTGSDLVTGPAPIVLATVQFTITSGASPTSTEIKLVPMVTAGAGTASTLLIGSGGTFPLNPNVSDAFVPGEDTRILVGAGRGIFPLVLPNGDVNAAYQQTIFATGGTAPYSFSVSSGTLPPGLIEGGDGVLSGTPSATGSFTFTIKVVDAASAISTMDYTVTINPAVSITTPTLAPWTANFAGYSQTLAASSGSGSYTFSSTGTLPPGLILSSTGLLSGTPTVPGSYSFPVSAIDSLGGSATQSYTVTINPPVSITTATLASGDVGAVYSASFTTIGGTGPATFSTTGLPAGLTLSSAGALSGTPTGTPGTVMVNVTATDAVGASGTQSLTLTINPAVMIKTPALPEGEVGGAYNSSITASGGSGSFTFTTAGTLPSGLTLSASGILSGIPTAVGAYTFSVTAADTLGGSATMSYTVIVTAVTVATASLADGDVAATYSQTLSATGGTSPYTFTTTAGALPAGLSLGSTGTVSGTPAVTGTFSFAITASDALGVSASQSYTITIDPAVAIATTTLAFADVGLAYDQTLQATGGSGSYTFVLTKGMLPPGMTLSSAGVLSGLPTTANAFAFTISAMDSLGGSGSESYTLVVNSAVVITDGILEGGAVGRPYNETIGAAGGTGGITFSSAGTLPSGLTLSANGVLFGTPSVGGSFSFTVTATDALGSSATKTYTVVIQELGLSSTLASWTVDQGGYSQPITVTGGTPPFAFAVTSGILPPGLLLSTAGVLSGSPTTAGAYAFTVMASDIAGDFGSQAYTVVINPALIITTIALKAGAVGLAYSQTLGTTGGTGLVTFSAPVASLPAGLTLSSFGVLSGTPSLVGSYSFTVTATDTTGASTSQLCTLAIGPNKTFLSMPTSGYMGMPGGTVLSFPININQLQDARSPTNHVGLVSTTIDITFPTGVFNFPVGGNLVSLAGLVHLGSVPLSHVPSGWLLTANSPTDGVLVISLSASPAATISTDSLPAGGSLVTIDFPVSSTYNPTAPTAQQIAVVTSSGISQTLILGANGPYVLNPPLPAFGNITINPAVKLTSLTTLAILDSAAGLDPVGALVEDSSGNLFSTAVAGGSIDNDGTVFEVPHGSSTSTTLAVFHGSNGAKPMAGLVLDSAGNLFGTTSEGGAFGDGTIFELAKGSGTITTLASFNGTNGSNCQAPLVADSSGNLFGTTAGGGSADLGTVFELAKGSGVITVLAQFNGINGTNPEGTLLLDSSGNLFGTTIGGGPSFSNGTVFEVRKGSGTITTLASFTGSIGAFVYSGVVADSAGNLYGTAVQGGAASKGMVFEVQKGSSSVTALANFTGPDGANPFDSGGVVVDSGGNVFGAADLGGAANEGTIFEVQKGSGKISTLVTFTGANGSSPVSGLIEDSAGRLFGTTQHGPAPNESTVFEMLAPTLSWTLNQPGFLQTFSASGGVGGIIFSITAGTLPPGLTLGTAGVLAGVPTATGTYAFTVTATDSLGTPATLSYTMTINPALSITTTTLAGGTVGTSYTQTIGATGGTGTVGFSVSAGTLPSGLTLTSVGILSGTPIVAGSFTFTVTATDALGSSATQSLTLVVDFPGTSPVYVDPSFTGADGSDPATDPGLGLQLGFNAFATITAAVGHVTPGGTSRLIIFGGTYTEPTINFNVGLSEVDLATNPNDSPANPTVTLMGAVAIKDGQNFNLTGVPTGTGTSMAANLDLASTEDGPGTLTIKGSAEVTFGAAVSGAVTVNGGTLNPTATVTLAGSGNLSIGNGLSETIGALASSSSSTHLVVGAGSILTTGGSASSTYAGAISGAGAKELDKAGPATSWTLTGFVSGFSGPINVVGTLVDNGDIGPDSPFMPTPLNLTDRSSMLTGTGTVTRPVVVTGSASGASVSGISITVAKGTGIDVQAGANNVAISGVMVSESSTGMVIEPGDGNMASVTGSTFTKNGIGLQVDSGCVTVTGNIIGGSFLVGNDYGVQIPAGADPLLTLEGNNITYNITGLQNSSTMGLTAILNWWGRFTGPGPATVDAPGTNPVVGVSVDNYTPYALDATSAAPNPTTFNLFNGTGTDGNVYVTGTLGQDTITATTAVLTDPHDIAVTVNGVTTTYARADQATNRIIIYGFGDNVSGTRDSISVTDSVGNVWNAEINAEPLKYLEPISFGGTSTSTILTSGFGSDVIFGGGNDIMSALTSGNNVLVVGKSTGKTGSSTAPRLSGGSGNNIYVAGYVDCTLAPLAGTGRLDYESLRAVDDLWASGLGGAADAMNAAALFSVVNTPGSILTGTARSTILPGAGQSWFVVKGAGNPVNSPTGSNADYIAGATTKPNYRQAVQ
jgi:uncharacterized repeat protein (TIGR03803 family)